MRIKLTEGLVSVTPPGVGAGFGAAPVGGLRYATGSAAAPTPQKKDNKANPTTPQTNQQSTAAPFKLDFSSDQGPRLNLLPNSSAAPAGGIAPATGGAAPAPKASPAPAGGIAPATGTTPRALPSNMVSVGNVGYGGFPPVPGSANLQGPSLTDTGIGPITGPVTSGTLTTPGGQAPLMTSTGEVNTAALSSTASTGAVPTSASTTTFKPEATPAWTPTSPAAQPKPQPGASLTQVASGTATPTQMAMIGVGEKEDKADTNAPSNKPQPQAPESNKPEESAEEKRAKYFANRKKLKRAQEEESDAEEEYKHARFLRKQARSVEKNQAVSAATKARHETIKGSRINEQTDFKFKRGELKIVLSEALMGKEWDPARELAKKFGLGAGNLVKSAANAGLVAAIPPRLIAPYSVGLVGHMGASRSASEMYKKHYANMFRTGVSDITKGLGLVASKIPGIGKGIQKLKGIANAVPYLGTLAGRAAKYGSDVGEGAAETFGVLMKRALLNPTTTDEYQIGDTYRDFYRSGTRMY